MKIEPILSFKHAFDETEESYESRQWIVDDSCKKFWDEFLKDKEISDNYNIFADDLVIKHWYYCAACSPSIEIIYNKSMFIKEFQAARAGDIFEIWVLSENPKYYTFICPNEHGHAPQKGSY